MNAKSTTSLFRVTNYIQRANISHSRAVNVRRNNTEIHTNEDEKNKRKPLAYDEHEFQQVLKVVQRFYKDPHEYPEEDKPFAMVDKNFLNKVMHVSELKPQRGFAIFLPFGMMLFRHFWRRMEAKAAAIKFESTDYLNEENIIPGTKKAFELIAQNAYNNTLDNLVERGICSQTTVDRFTAAGAQMSERQRHLLNLTQNDIFAIAPGPYKHFQMIKPVSHNGEPYLAYSLLCCAFYKKKILYDAVRDLTLLDKSEEAQSLPIPAEYGYDAPRTIFGYMTFGNRFITKFEQVDSEVKLIDFQFLVM